jgi:hypothetical protein
VLSDHRRCGSSHTHWREQIALHAPSAVIGTYDSIRRNSSADFVIVTIHQLMDSASSHRIEDEPALLRRSARTGGQDHKLQSQYHIPSNADHLWAVTATPSHAKYLSENFGNITKVLRIPAVNPVCCKYYRHFNALRKMIIRGYRRRCGQSLPKLIINTPYLSTTTWQNYNLSCTPQVTLDAGTISKITRAVRTSASTRNYPSSSVVNTMPVQYDHLPVVNHPLHGHRTAASVTSLWTTVSPCPCCRHVLLPVSP